MNGILPYGRRKLIALFSRRWLRPDLVRFTHHVGSHQYVHRSPKERDLRKSKHNAEKTHLPVLSHLPTPKDRPVRVDLGHSEVSGPST